MNNCFLCFYPSKMIFQIVLWLIILILRYDDVSRMKFGTIKTCWFRHQNLHMEIQSFSSLPILSFPFHKLCMILHDSKWHSVIICISGIYTNGGCLYVSLIVRLIFPEKEKIQIKVKRLSHKKNLFCVSIFVNFVVGCK